jgi:ABC-type lipoprotein release transport system permease subunit
MNPVHAGPRLTWQRLAVSVATTGAFLWLAIVQLTGWVFVGVFLVAEFVLYQAFAKLVRKRRRDLALLRCFGASRGQIFGGVLVEALAVGFLGSVVAIVGAVVVQRVQISDCVSSVVLGMFGALLAGVVPAVRASRVKPGGP